MMKVGVTNSKIDMATREALTEEEMELRATGSKIWMSGWCTYSATVWTLKFCMVCSISFTRTNLELTLRCEDYLFQPSDVWHAPSNPNMTAVTNLYWRPDRKSLHRQKLITYAFWITGISGVCVYLVFWLSCLYASLILFEPLIFVLTSCWPIVRPTYKLFQSFPYPGGQFIYKSSTPSQFALSDMAQNAVRPKHPCFTLAPSFSTSPQISTSSAFLSRYCGMPVFP